MLGLFIVAGTLFTLLIVSTIYKKVKASNGGREKRKVKAQIESIFKLRVPLEARGERERFINNNTILPSSVYQMVFRNCDTDEFYSFSVKGGVVERLKEKETGLLTFKGDRFIGFQKG